MDTDTQKVAMVTGSSNGIGAAIASHLASGGYSTVVTYHEDKHAGQRVVGAIQGAGGHAVLRQLDVTSEKSVAELFAFIAEEFGHLDVLVNNAVRELSRPLHESTLDQWRTTLATKLDGAFFCTRAALPLFQAAARPSMIAISTYESEQPDPDYPAYSVANSGLNAFVRAMALYLPRYGARCNAVCPGAVRTPLWGRNFRNDDLWQEKAAANPVGRNATPDDIAAVVRLLAEEPTRMMNGNFLYVNGGSHLL